MFHHYTFSDGGSCDFWLFDESGTSPPLVLFFDGALSLEDRRAREEQQIHLPFFSQLAEDLYRFASLPFNFVVIPGDCTPLESSGNNGDLLSGICSFLEGKGRKTGRIHLVGYSKGARNCFRYLTQGAFEGSNIVSFSSFSGAYLFNPQMIKKTEVQRLLKPLTLIIGALLQELLYTLNVSRFTCDEKIFFCFVLHESHLQL
jgi:dienelactone hydrolase